jgi:6-phosphofructokinase
MPGETSDANEVDKIVTRLLVILLDCWRETGFGHIEIKSERIKRDRIAVTIMGSTHYRFVISKEELQNWWIGEENLSHATIEYENSTQLNNHYKTE